MRHRRIDDTRDAQAEPSACRSYAPRNFSLDLRRPRDQREVIRNRGRIDESPPKDSGRRGGGSGILGHRGVGRRPADPLGVSDRAGRAAQSRSARDRGRRLQRTPVLPRDDRGEERGPRAHRNRPGRCRGDRADPFGGRAVPCLSGAGSLEGCEACGAPPNTSPGIVPFVSGAAPFADPFFLIDLFQSFAPGGGGPDPYPNDPIVVADMETAAVARVAAARQIPFLAFRALSDSDAADHGGDPLMLPGFPVTFFVYAQLATDNAAAAVIAFLSLR